MKDTKEKEQRTEKTTASRLTRETTQPALEVSRVPVVADQIDTETPDNENDYQIYNNIIYGIVDSFIESEYAGRTQEELKQDKAFFPRLTQYLYNNYIGDLLGNKHGKQIVYKDIKQLDILFNIYLDLVYKYKWNNKPFIVEFSLLTGINKNTFYNWLNGLDNNIYGGAVDSIITPERRDIVQNWVDTCERALLDGSDTIRDIFILKAKHNYRDNNNVMEINVNHRQLITADQLPQLIEPPKQ